ncbi:hypothetical protein HK100_011847, partial [Physocladia obscura]
MTSEDTNNTAQQSEIEIDAAEPLSRLIKSIDDQKYNFDKQINTWMGRDVQPTIEDDRTEKLDVRALLLANPKNMESELQFHKELFSKLKFNYLEQSTKEAFLRRILAKPVEWATTDEIKTTEKVISELKSDLKAYKKKTESIRENLAQLVDEVNTGGKHKNLLKNRGRADELWQRAAPLNAEIAEILQKFDPEQKTLSELLKINQELSQLQELVDKQTAVDAENAAATAESAHLSTVLADLQTKVNEAKNAVHLRDPNLDGYLVWCQSWTTKLMELQGIVQIEAVSINKLKVTFAAFDDTEDGAENNNEHKDNFENDISKNVQLHFEIHTNTSVLLKKSVDAKLINSDIDISDIVNMANTTDIQSSAGTAHIIWLIAQETRTRVWCWKFREVEKKRLEIVDGLHMCWDDEEGLVEVGVATTQGRATDDIRGVQGEKIVQVRIDGGYPMHWSCMEIISVLPDGGDEELKGLQSKIESDDIKTVTDLIKMLQT